MSELYPYNISQEDYMIRFKKEFNNMRDKYNKITTINNSYKNKKEELKMELKDTVEMMNSEDFKERFRAEYFQVKIRYDKLDDMTVKYEAGTLPFTPNCSLELLLEQKEYMGEYLRCLKIRAEIEGINLNS